MIRDYGPDYDPSLALKWVEALESGDFAQTKSHLRVGNSYCCLGVACQVSGAGKWEGGIFRYDLDPYDDLPPVPLMDRFGIQRNYPWDNRYWNMETHPDLGVTGLDAINDRHELTFAQIAALLRAYYGFPPRDEPTPPPLAEDAICDGYDEE